MILDSRQPFDVTEDALRELHDAELTGVFQRTVLPALSQESRRKVNSDFSPASSWASRGVMLGLAATLLMAIGVWTTMFGYQISRLRQDAATPGGEVVASNSAPTSEIDQFERCLAGPGGSKTGACASFDYDRNGRVDLHDFSARQRATLLASN
ncbi:MAG: hypothetical protein HY287_13745 [Planctomycetes bacterium]|nr:hypothetical protein [Planctomycetota bacterium]MBI3835386.1 hypothetical protein [Planctomycetota bacterium]